MELSQLKYFCALAKLEHMTRAAESLHITQPALSRAISSLEKELGIALFDRVGKQVRLNAAGQDFYNRLTGILEDLDDAKARLTDIQSGDRGVLRIGTTFPVETSSLLQRNLRQFFLDHPAVSQHIYVYELSMIESLLADRKLEFGLSLQPSTRVGISFEHLYSERLGVVVNKDHPLADRTVISLRDVAQERFLSHIAAPDTRDNARYICKLAGYDANVIYEGSDTPLISHAVAMGLGVNLMPEEKFYEYMYTTKDPTWQHNLRFLQVEEEFCSRPVYLLYRSGRYQSAIGQCFMAGLKEQMRKEGKEPFERDQSRFLF